MKCIISNEEKTNFRKEHVFPEAIGGTFTIPNVSEEWNSFLGHSVDTHLVNHPFIKIARLSLGVLGKQRAVPNPFTEGVLVDVPGLRVRYRLKDSGEPESLEVVEQVERQTREDGTKVITITGNRGGEKQIADILNKILQRRNLSPLSDDEILKHTLAKSLQLPWIRYQYQINLEAYKIAIVKIAYEMACYWLGNDYLDEPLAEILRKCLRNSTPNNGGIGDHPVTAVIGLSGSYGLFPLWQDIPDCHITLLKELDGALWCGVRVFSVFEGYVQISNDVSRHRDHERFMVIDPVTGRFREEALQVELARLVDHSERTALQ